MRSLANIFNLGLKEFRSLQRDYAMLVLILWAFSLGVYSSATGIPETLHHAPIAVVDEDRSQLSTRLVNAFQPPYFRVPELIDQGRMDRGMDTGLYTFTLDIPPDFQRDVLAGRNPAVQLNVDATQIGQAFSGAGYIQNIVSTEVNEFVARYRGEGDAGGADGTHAVQPQPDPGLVWRSDGGDQPDHHAVDHPHRRGPDPRARARHRRAPAGDAAVGVRDHAGQGLVHGRGGAGGRRAVAGVRGARLAGGAHRGLAGAVPGGGGAAPVRHHVDGHLPRHRGAFDAAAGAADHPGADAASDPFRGTTPRESMPELVQQIMLAAPTTHFVAPGPGHPLSRRGLDIVWPQFLAIIGIGSASSPP